MIWIADRVVCALGVLMMVLVYAVVMYHLFGRR